MKPLKMSTSTYPQTSISQFLDDFFFKNMTDFVGNDMRRTTIPAVNIMESEDQFHLELAAPGLKKEDFNIRIEDDHILIGASKEESEKSDTEKYKRREFLYSSFERKFALPEDIRRDGITAEYTDGILRVSLPKTEEKKAIARTIEIQ